MDFDLLLSAITSNVLPVLLRTIVKMKRAAPWEKSLVISSDDSSDSDSEDDGLATKMSRKNVGPQSSKDHTSEGLLHGSFFFTKDD